MKYIRLLCATLAVAACSKKNQNAVSETAGGAVAPAAAGTDTMGTSGTAGTSDTGAMRGSSDTGMRSDSMRADSSRRDTTGSRSSSGMSSDTAQNQTQSGMTNAKKGKSTLGPRAKKATPTQGAPVTSKGDTLRSGGDTTPRPH